MNKTIIKAFDQARGDIYNKLLTVFPYYTDLLKLTLTEMLKYGNGYDLPDPERIMVIDHGDYQGTLVMVMPMSGIGPPETYFATSVNYGSCSVCDTVQRIHNIENDHERAKQLMVLALHMIQRMRVAVGRIDDDSEYEPLGDDFIPAREAGQEDVGA
jgi:hypothetical protein